MKNFFKKKAQKLAQQPEVPRAMDEIKKDYQELSAQVANAQYTAFIKAKEVEQLNLRLLSLNQEASERTKLDSQEVSKKAKVEEVSKSAEG